VLAYALFLPGSGIADSTGSGTHPSERSHLA
jgi:hypothetical protein